MMSHHLYTRSKKIVREIRKNERMNQRIIANEKKRARQRPTLLDCGLVADICINYILTLKLTEYGLRILAFTGNTELNLACRGIELVSCKFFSNTLFVTICWRTTTIFT